MILINLLPHREVARKKRKEQFLVFAASAALAGGALALLVSTWYQHATDVQRQRNGLLTTEIQKLDSQIKDIAGLRAEIQGLRARQTAVENLQSDRNTPVYLLNQLVEQVPEGIYLVSIKQENQVVSIAGVAQSQERVSELLRNLSANGEWLTRPELVEIAAAVQQLSQKEQRRVYNFTMRAQLVRAGVKDAASADAPEKK